MPFFRLILFGLFLLAILMGWSWLQSLQTPWVRQHRGVAGWLVAMLLLVFMFLLLRMFLPKI